jgi:hypothetical protein
MRWAEALSTGQLFVLALSFGVALGIPVGITAFQYGWSKGAPGDHHAFSDLDGDAVCVNGIVYVPHHGEIGSPWNGIYQPAEQGQPALHGEDGREILRRAIPVPCKASRG